MKKILIINYEFPPLGGGGGNASKHIAVELGRKGYLVSVLTSRYRGLPARELVDGIDVWRIPTLRRFRERSSIFEMVIFLFMSLVYVLPAYRQSRPDFVISFFSIPSGPAALLLKLIMRVPYIVALRGGDVPGFLPEQLALFHRFTNWLTRLIWAKAAVVTANSEGLADLARRFYDRCRLVVVPNGVDERFFYERGKGGRERDQWPAASGQKGKNTLRILTAGRLSRQKKVERLIEAMRCLKAKSGDSFELRIVGDGPERRRLEALARGYGLLNKTVFFHGWCDREDLLAFYRHADVFALASDYEGMPNAVLEAMAASLAVVATPSAGTIALIADGKNGFLIYDRSARAFCDVFLRFWNDRGLLKSCQNASFDRVRGRSWARIASAYEALGKAATSLSKPARLADAAPGEGSVAAK